MPVLVVLGAAAALATGGAAAVGTQVGTLDVVTRGNGAVLSTYAKDGRHWVVGTPGQEYSLRVCNTTGGRLLAVMSVDGVNVITGDTASPAQSGYVLSAYECADIDGWCKSLARTAAFYFTALPDSYAARTGRPANVGVVGVAFYRERAPSAATFPELGRISAGTMGKSASREQEAQASSPAAADTASPGNARASAEGSAPEDARANAQSAGALTDHRRETPSPAAKLGTGHGRSEASYAQMTQFERESATPTATVAIHYDRRENLIAMGVLPAPAIARTPNPFPAWSPRFVPDPYGR